MRALAPCHAQHTRKRHAACCDVWIPNRHQCMHAWAEVPPRKHAQKKLPPPPDSDCVPPSTPPSRACSHARIPSHTQLLKQHNILSAPILDERGEYRGCVSVSDLLRGIFRSEWQGREGGMGEGRGSGLGERVCRGVEVWRGCCGDEVSGYRRGVGLGG